MTAALESCGLDWSISEEQSLYDGHSAFILNNADGKYIANISCEDAEGRCGLIVASTTPVFEGTTSSTSAKITKDEWESVARLGSLLYGGFESEIQVYSRFIDEYEKIYEYSEKTERNTAIWHYEFEGIHCIAEVWQQSAETGEEYLAKFEFYNQAGYDRWPELYEKYRS